MAIFVDLDGLIICTSYTLSSLVKHDELAAPLLSEVRRPKRRAAGEVVAMRACSVLPNAAG